MESLTLGRGFITDKNNNDNNLQVSLAQDIPGILEMFKYFRFQENLPILQICRVPRNFVEIPWNF